MRSLLPILALLVLSAPALAAERASWPEYLTANRYVCPGPLDTLAQPRELEIGGKSYLHTGYRLEVKNPDKDSNVRIGVIGASKDLSSGTRRNIESALAWFQKEGVEWLIADGDLALDEFDFEEVVALLAESGLPVLVVLGNSDSRGSWARVYKSSYEKYPNLIDGVLVRQIIADDVEFWTVSGYYDKRFVKQFGACNYKPEDVDILGRKLEASGSVPVALVSHGPPKGRGKNGIDRITDGKNVGDPALTRLISKAKIPFGIFSHILEAGGAGVGANMKKRIKPQSPVKSLYVNAGSISGDPWRLNTGQVSYGMAMIVEIKGKTASYRVKRFESTFE